MKGRRHRKRKKQFHIPRKLEKARKVNSNFLTGNLGTKRGTHLHRSRHNLLKRNIRKRWEETEPLVDVIEEKDKIIVVAELAGFKQESLKILVRDRRLILSAENSGRKYYKTLTLPKMVIKDSTDTSYKNGVLQIKLRQALHEEAIDKDAN